MASSPESPATSGGRSIPSARSRSFRPPEWPSRRQRWHRSTWASGARQPREGPLQHRRVEGGAVEGDEELPAGGPLRELVGGRARAGAPAAPGRRAGRWRSRSRRRRSRCRGSRPDRGRRRRAASARSAAACGPAPRRRRPPAPRWPGRWPPSGAAAPSAESGTSDGAAARRSDQRRWPASQRRDSSQGPMPGVSRKVERITAPPDPRRCARRRWPGRGPGRRA